MYFVSKFLTFNVSTTPLYFIPIHYFLTRICIQWKKYQRPTIQIIIFCVFSLCPEIILDIMEKKTPGAHICTCVHIPKPTHLLLNKLLLDTKTLLSSSVCSSIGMVVHSLLEIFTKQQSFILSLTPWLTTHPLHSYGILSILPSLLLSLSLPSHSEFDTLKTALTHLLMQLPYSYSLNPNNNSYKMLLSILFLLLHFHCQHYEFSLPRVNGLFK